MRELSRLAVLGAGHVGPVIARLALKAGYPVAIARLDLRKRSGEPDSYDVEIGVSAYDRVEKAESSASPTPTGGAANP